MPTVKVRMGEDLIHALEIIQSIFIMDESNFIKRTLELAEKGRGNVSPNPMVGSVIVKDGRIISEGFHEKYGENHAEINAIKNAHESIKGAALYVNLEPCSHFGKTPPCVDAIIKSGIKKVVIGDIDPNPDVNGRGISILRENGIEVICGIETGKCRDLNRIYYKYMVTKMPFISLKIAQTINGKISFKKGERASITCSASLKKVHKLRSEYDAVVIGRNTAGLDNPLLTVRHVKGRSPKRFILDSYLDLHLDLKMLSGDMKKNTYICVSEKCSNEKIEKFRNAEINLIKLPESKKDHIDIREFLKYLGANNVSSLLVEGGAQLFTEFIREKVADYYYIFISPRFSSGGENSFNQQGNLIENIKFLKTKKIDEDILIEGEAV